MIIDRFEGKYMFLSNFFTDMPPVMGYPTSEHAYQAMKTTDKAQRNAIRTCGSPGMSKKLGRKVTMRSDWDLIKYDVMKFVLMEKFQAGSELAELLLKTGYSDLVEGNYWHDQTWGDCSCGRDACKPAGKNWLGILLNERRTLLREVS